MVKTPDALGSGNALTPWARMHSANFTAFVWTEAVPLPPLAAVLFPQPATIAASVVRAARGHSVLLISSLPCADWIDSGAVDTDIASPNLMCLASCWFAVDHATSLGSTMLPARK